MNNKVNHSVVDKHLASIIWFLINQQTTCPCFPLFRGKFNFHKDTSSSN